MMLCVNPLPPPQKVSVFYAMYTKINACFICFNWMRGGRGEWNACRFHYIKVSWKASILLKWYGASLVERSVMDYWSAFPTSVFFSSLSGYLNSFIYSLFALYISRFLLLFTMTKQVEDFAIGHVICCFSFFANVVHEKWFIFRANSILCLLERTTGTSLHMQKATTEYFKCFNSRWRILNVCWIYVRCNNMFEPKSAQVFNILNF